MPPSSGRERFRLRITLLDTEPEIWRTLDVDGSLRLDELHGAIQIAMGWRDVHLHEFGDDEPFSGRHGIPQIGRPPRRWMPADQLADAHDGLAFGGRVEELIDEHEADVASVFDRFDGPFFYWYDFGDSWWHRIDLIEREVVDAPGASTPPWARRVELVAGERRGPLEDSGGVHGYAELLDTLADPTAPDHHEVRAWVTGTAWPETSAPEASRPGASRPETSAPAFDPAAFDRDAVDRELALRFEVASDVSGLVLGDDDDPVAPDAPIVGLLEQLPSPLRAELRRRLRTSGALEPVQIDADVAARMVRPYVWLLDRIGPDGLTLTKAGWMPPAVVLEGMTELGWLDDWFGTATREDNTTPIRSLRESARRFGLVRVMKGRLLRTTAGTRLRNDPVALWRYLATAAVERHRSDAERLAALLVAVDVACGGDCSLQRLGGYVASGLDVLGWSQSNGMPLDAGDGIELVRDTWRVLLDLGVFGAERPRLLRRTDPPPTPDGRAFARAMLGVR
ncbi:plasmid pRiA4b ORF-3 family protein [Agromyces sp. H66]|uniref:plasmid pRiA4b ORF-3 family protein n=1 Tax=Agromyces sp. H66 TaxID=2529859 RepID=UPI00145B146A|nr:plasmid pRiA4b ORF-3 family protein [Agromyces sp. H66]